MKFDKPTLNLNEKISLLEKRGLIIENKEEAKHYLLTIGYFRLTGYLKFFQDKETNIFHEGTRFHQVIRVYNFDRKLRLLTLDAIEKIEVSTKSIINYVLYKEYGFYRYLNRDLFMLDQDWKEEIYTHFLEKVESKKEKSSAIFVKEFYKKYDEKHLPSWMLFEELTIGEISTIYKLLDSKMSQKVANEYKTYFVDLKKWLQLIVNVRNISAHHARLRNKSYVKRPRIGDVIFKDKFLTEKIGNKLEVIPNFYNTALIINYLLLHINKNFNWINDLENLFNEFSDIPKNKMGFDKDRKQKIKI